MYLGQASANIHLSSINAIHYNPQITFLGHNAYKSILVIDNKMQKNIGLANDRCDYCFQMIGTNLSNR